MSKLRMLGVLLCYNDGDILADSIHHLRNNNHDVVVWNHGSTDETGAVLAKLRHELVELTDISRDVDFYDLYPLMSKHLLETYVRQYDWISWPDQDEILEGPTREKSYCDFLEDVAQSTHAWIEFNDLVYWYTNRDDQTITSPCERIRHYSIARHGPAKIRSWKASATNIRWFNHNRAEGSRHPTLFNLRHYPMRSEAQMKRRIFVDRAGIQRGPVNFHYENMKATLAASSVEGCDLHFDDGRTDLSTAVRFDWGSVYGAPPKYPPDVLQSYVQSTKRWEVAAVVKKSLETLPSSTVSEYGNERIRTWLRALDTKITGFATITFEKGHAKIIADEATDESTTNSSQAGAPQRPAAGLRVDLRLDDVACVVSADASDRSIRVAAKGELPAEDSGAVPLVALVPCYGGDVPRISRFESGQAAFGPLKALHYFLTCDKGGRAAAEDESAR